jgi:hypothetical protein
MGGFGGCLRDSSYLITAAGAQTRTLEPDATTATAERAIVDNPGRPHLDCHVLVDGAMSSPPSDTRESLQDEENLSAQQPEAKADPWVSGAVARQGGTARLEEASPEGASAHRGLKVQWGWLARNGFGRGPISSGSCVRGCASTGATLSSPCAEARTRRLGWGSRWVGAWEARSRGTASSVS